MPIQIELRAPILALIAALVLTGCNQLPPLSPTWQKDIPGTYVGSKSSFREMLNFKTDGTFQHQIFQNGKIICSESGKWHVVSHERQITLKPFTEFYDRLDQLFSPTGSSYLLYYYYPLPDDDGKGEFHYISAMVEFQFCLTKQTTSE